MRMFTQFFLTSVAVALFSAGCATTGSTQNLTLAERRAAVDEAIVEADGQEKAVSDVDYDPNEIICKTVKKTATRLGKSRDCRTAEEWRQTMTTANRSINDLQNSKGGIGTKMQ